MLHKLDCNRAVRFLQARITGIYLLFYVSLITGIYIAKGYIASQIQSHLTSKLAGIFRARYSKIPEVTF